MTYTASWRAPSNIALIKYWGKYGLQLPRNPSMSFTLSACHTNMHLHVTPGANSPGLVVLYDGQPRPSFEPKILIFLARLQDLFPWLATASIVIDSHNTFPYGVGIASSASAMSAMALCLSDINNQIRGPANQEGISENLLELAAKKSTTTLDNLSLQKVSQLARLGSGSACRSVYPIASIWGKTENLDESSDSFAIPWGDHVSSVFKDYQDTILIVSSSEKSVPSTAGHQLMDKHPYAEIRYAEAGRNITRLVECMRRDDALDSFISIVESEALQLHAMMMSGETPFILIKPGTVAIIKEIWRFRRESNIPVCFTLDAGPNVHLLYPLSHKEKILDWVVSELVQYCSSGKYILDHIGYGPEKIS